MKKSVLMLAIIFGFSTAFVSCRDQKRATAEDEMSEQPMDEISGEPGEVSEAEEANRERGDIQEAAEDVGDVIEEGAEETGEFIDETAEDVGDAAEEGWQEVKENTGTGNTDDK